MSSSRLTQTLRVKSISKKKFEFEIYQNNQKVLLPINVYKIVYSVDIAKTLAISVNSMYVNCLPKRIYGIGPGSNRMK